MLKFGMAVACVAGVFSSGALAQPVLIPGQYLGVTQYTALIDPAGLCGSAAGLAVGQITNSVSTVPGLGKATTSTIANPGTANGPQGYGVGWINCKFPPLPAATAFTKQSDGSYTSSPTAVQTVLCTASNGQSYTLVSSNGSSGGQTQSNLITVIPLNAPGKDSGFKLTSKNTAVMVGSTTLCYLSTDALYLNTQK